MKTQACMGGFKCRIREGCANYHAEYREEPSERLCKRGEDGVGRDTQILIRRSHESVESVSPPAGSLRASDAPGMDKAGSGCNDTEH